MMPDPTVVIFQISSICWCEPREMQIDAQAAACFANDTTAAIIAHSSPDNTANMRVGWSMLGFRPTRLAVIHQARNAVMCSQVAWGVKLHPAEIVRPEEDWGVGRGGRPTNLLPQNSRFEASLETGKAIPRDELSSFQYSAKCPQLADDRNTTAKTPPCVQKCVALHYIHQRRRFESKFLPAAPRPLLPGDAPTPIQTTEREDITVHRSDSTAGVYFFRPKVFRGCTPKTLDVCRREPPDMRSPEKRVHPYGGTTHHIQLI